MRFMILMKASKASEAGQLPSEQLLTEMGRYNEELVNAGVLVGGEGLHPTSNAVRVKFDGNKATVVEGPFPYSSELVAGFWIFEVKSRDEAIEWIKRCPNTDGEHVEIEIRQIFTMEDFAEVMTPELREQEDRLRARTGG